MENILAVALVLPLLLLALSVHEFAHAWVANKLGDPTPKMMGRVTLNPLAHLDPVGTSLLVFTLIFSPIAFGWAKPVVFNPYYLKNPKTDTGLVALAGPASNILMAILAVMLLVFSPYIALLQIVLTQFIILNIVLAVFNLIPIYPLDGFNIVASYLPHNLEADFRQTAQYGQWILLILIFTGAIGTILGPVVGFVLDILNRLL